MCWYCMVDLLHKSLYCREGAELPCAPSPPQNCAKNCSTKSSTDLCLKHRLSIPRHTCRNSGGIALRHSTGQIDNHTHGIVTGWGSAAEQEKQITMQEAIVTSLMPRKKRADKETAHALPTHVCYCESFRVLLCVFCHIISLRLTSHVVVVDTAALLRRSSKMGIGGKFPSMLKACAPKRSVVLFSLSRPLAHVSLDSDSEPDAQVPPPQSCPVCR